MEESNGPGPDVNNDNRATEQEENGMPESRSLNLECSNHEEWRKSKGNEDPSITSFINRILSEKKELEKGNETLEQHNQVLGQGIADMHHQSELEQEERNLLRTIIDRLKVTCKELKRQLSHEKKNNTNLEERLKEKAIKHGELKVTCKELKRQLSHEKKKNTNLEERLKEKAIKYRELKVTCKELKRHLSHEKNNNTNLEERLKEKDIKDGEVEAKCEELKEQLSQEKKQTTKLEEDVDIMWTIINGKDIEDGERQCCGGDMANPSIDCNVAQQEKEQQGTNVRESQLYEEWIREIMLTRRAQTTFQKPVKIIRALHRTWNHEYFEKYGLELHRISEELYFDYSLSLHAYNCV